jgi:hypothetical protein
MRDKRPINQTQGVVLGFVTIMITLFTLGPSHHASPLAALVRCVAAAVLGAGIILALIAALSIRRRLLPPGLSTRRSILGLVFAAVGVAFWISARFSSSDVADPAAAPLVLTSTQWFGLVLIAVGGVLQRNALRQGRPSPGLGHDA